MKFLRLSALVLFAVTTLTACKRDTEFTKITEFRKNGINMTGALNVPQTPSTALGTMDIWYSKETRILTYTMNWSGLTGAVTSASVMGPAPTGFPSATTVQNFSTSAIIRCATFPVSSCGSYKGTLLVDGFVVTEENLLAGVYYVTLRTAAYPATGEIRGQIKFD
ncbi:MAG: CHRD domain-containing protein [Bacteroidota bacterium]